MNPFSAVPRDGRWKLHLPHSYRQVAKVGHGGKPGTYRQEKIGLALFDMAKDPFETSNVIESHPEVAARMQALAEQHRQAFFAAKK